MSVKLKTLGAVLGALVVLTSCATNGPAEFCLIYEPVFMAAEDHLTPETERQIIENNEVWEAICG